MQDTLSRMKRVQNWILSVKLGQYVLLILSSLFILPEHFWKENARRRPWHTRLGPCAVTIAASTIFSITLPRATSIALKAHGASFEWSPDIVVEVFGLPFSINLYFWICALCIVGFSLWRWLVHCFVVWVSKYVGEAVPPVPVSYFVIIASNFSGSFGIVCYVGVWLGLSLTVQDMEVVLSSLQNFPWLLLISMLMVCGVFDRRESIKKKTAQQLYPNAFFRFMMPFIVGLGPIFITQAVVTAIF